MNSKNFFAELKRRNVYKVAIAYAVIAWLLIQAGSILFPTFEAPGWVMKVFVTVVAAGFVIALIVAWAFEMTPQGMKRTEDLAPDEFIPQWSKRKFLALIVTLAVVAAGLLAFQVWRTQRASPAAIAPEKSIADLKVASRTSTQHYKSMPENLAEIAKQLGVAHILEGSVQKSGDAVRVNVQLIK